MKLFHLLMLLALVAQAKTIQVAVIDTGILPRQNIKICKDGLIDLSGYGIYDRSFHGTVVSKIIEQYAKSVDYCQVIIKWHDPKNTMDQNTENMSKAIEIATALKVDVINISGGGMLPNDRERKAVARALGQGITMVVAAGNEGCKMPYNGCTYYPAMYDPRIIVVGSRNSRGISSASNLGAMVDYYVEDLVLTERGYGTGTSFATPKVTGTVIKLKEKLRRKYAKKN
jgi:subtilisin family serine protease